MASNPVFENKLYRLSLGDDGIYLGKVLLKAGDMIRFTGELESVLLEMVNTRYGSQLGYKQKIVTRGRHETKTYTLNNSLGARAVIVGTTLVRTAVEPKKESDA